MGLDVGDALDACWLACRKKKIKNLSFQIDQDVCVCVYYCRTYDKAVCGGEGDSEGHVL